MNRAISLSILSRTLFTDTHFNFTSIRSHLGNTHCVFARYRYRAMPQPSSHNAPPITKARLHRDCASLALCTERMWHSDLTVTDCWPHGVKVRAQSFTIHLSLLLSETRCCCLDLCGCCPAFSADPIRQCVCSPSFPFQLSFSLRVHSRVTWINTVKSMTPSRKERSTRQNQHGLRA